MPDMWAGLGMYWYGNESKNENVQTKLREQGERMKMLDLKNQPCVKRGSLKSTFKGF